MSFRPLAAASLARLLPSAAHAQDLQPGGRILPRAQHFGRRPAFRKGELLVHDQRAAQRYREQHAQHAAKAGDRQHPPEMKILPVAENHQRRHREYHPRGDRTAGGAAGLDDVVFQDAAATQRAQHGHRHHRGRDGRGDGHAGEQSQVGIGGGEHRGQDNREQDGRHRQLPWHSRIHEDADPLSAASSALVMGLRKKLSSGIDCTLMP